ncbi:NUDIX hydrolase [bacterium]|nr:NUDIX hydrolase [bacterium]
MKEPVAAHQGWTRRGSRYLFESRWFKLRQDDLTLPGGLDITYTLVEHPGYAMVVPLLDDGRVVMEHVYRHTVEKTCLECPSGCVEGEPPEVAAGRELEEETGYVAERMEFLGAFFGSNGISDERFSLFLASGLSQTGRIQREPTEEIEVELIPLARLVEQVLRGEIEDAPSALAVLLAHARVESP